MNILMCLFGSVDGLLDRLIGRCKMQDGSSLHSASIEQKQKEMQKEEKGTKRFE
jgi:hypothetical protein